MNYRDEQQLLDSGDRGFRPADDDCLRTFDLLLGLPSRSWLRSGDKCCRESRRPRDALSGAVSIIKTLIQLFSFGHFLLLLWLKLQCSRA